MPVQTRENLKEKFKTGAKPTQQDFEDLIDSYFNLNDQFNTLIPFANQAQAESGNDNNNLMTPLRTLQAIIALVRLSNIQGLDTEVKTLINTAVSNLKTEILGGAGAAYDTLGELKSEYEKSDQDLMTTLTALIGGKLVKENNLSDLANTVLARQNLGLGDAATLGVSDAWAVDSSETLATSKAVYGLYSRRSDSLDHEHSGWLATSKAVFDLNKKVEGINVEEDAYLANWQNKKIHSLNFVRYKVTDNSNYGYSSAGIKSFFVINDRLIFLARTEHNSVNNNTVYAEMLEKYDLKIGASQIKNVSTENNTGFSNVDSNWSGISVSNDFVYLFRKDSDLYRRSPLYEDGNGDGADTNSGFVGNDPVTGATVVMRCFQTSLKHTIFIGGSLKEGGVIDNIHDFEHTSTIWVNVREDDSFGHTGNRRYFRIENDSVQILDGCNAYFQLSAKFDLIYLLILDSGLLKINAYLTFGGMTSAVAQGSYMNFHRSLTIENDITNIDFVRSKMGAYGSYFYVFIAEKNSDKSVFKIFTRENPTEAQLTEINSVEFTEFVSSVEIDNDKVYIMKGSGLLEIYKAS